MGLQRAWQNLVTEHHHQQYSIVYMHHICFIYSSVHGQLGYFVLFYCLNYLPLYICSINYLKMKLERIDQGEISIPRN